MYKVNICPFEIGKNHMWLKQAALKTIYAGRILPLILYGAPVWKGVMDIACYKAKIIRVKRLINIKIAKVCGTVSNEALSVITGLIPIHIKIEESKVLPNCKRTRKPARSGNGNKTLGTPSTCSRNYRRSRRQ